MIVLPLTDLPQRLLGPISKSINSQNHIVRLSNSLELQQFALDNILSNTLGEMEIVLSLIYHPCSMLISKCKWSILLIMRQITLFAYYYNDKATQLQLEAHDVNSIANIAINHLS